MHPTPQETNGSSNGVLQDLANLKNQTRIVADSLRTQDEALRQRGLRLPPGVTDKLSELIKDIAGVESSVASDSIELGQLRSLAATGAMINSTLDLDNLLTRAMDEVILLAGAERGFIILANENSGDLEFRIRRDETQRPTTSDTPQISMTIVNDVMASQKPLLADNAYKDPRIQDNLSVAQFVLRSVICVPLYQRGKTIGVVYVDNRLRAGVFTERELNLLTAFANQAAVAIENARLFTRIQTSLTEITEMKDVIDNVFASVGSGIITTNASDLVITFNRTAEKLFGWHSDEAVGKPLLDVLPRIDDADIESQMRDVLEQEVSGEFQAIVTLPQQDYPATLKFKFSPLKDENDVTQGVTVVVDDLTEQNEREALINVLENYLPPGLLPRIHEIAQIGLGGERREVTCMFAESRPYNSFDPEIAPQDLMATLNRYLTVGAQAVQLHDGVIDKYMGSEIMVLFNTQLNPQPDHTLRAIDAALDMRDAFVAFYKEIGIDPDLHWYRIGINSGIATLGNVGSVRRRNFTAIGDTINLSKRLQENATAGQIIISEATLLQARAAAGAHDIPGVRLEERDPIKVKGREQYTRIFEIFRDDT